MTRKALLTPGCPTSCPIAVISRVRASKGRMRAAIGEGGISADLLEAGYGGNLPSWTRKWKMACKTSTTWRKLWYGTKALYADRLASRNPVRFSASGVSMWRHTSSET